MNKKTLSLAFVSTLLASLFFVSFVRATVGPVEFVTTIALDVEPNCIAVNEETNQVYVGTETGLLVIDCTTDMVVTEILPDADVRTITFNLQTNRIYVSDYPNGIVVIDSTTKQQVGEISEHAYSSEAIAINPVTNLIYIQDQAVFEGQYDCLAVYNGETNTLMTRVNMPGSNTHDYVENVHVTVNPETNRIYATWSGDNSLHVIDGDTNSILKTVSPSSFRYGVVKVNPYTNYVYVGNVALDGDTLEEVFSDYEGDLEAVDPVNNLLYTIGQYYNLTDHSSKYYLWVLNGTTHDVITSYELESLDWISHRNDHLGVNCNNGKVYIVNRDETEIPVVVIPELSSRILISTFIIATLAVVIYGKTAKKGKVSSD